MTSPTSDDDLLRRPIVILGSPRSGTAILAHVLRAHPDLVYFREPRLVWRYGNDERSDMLRPAHATPAVRDHIRRHFAEGVRAGGGRRVLEKTPSNALRPEFVDAIFPDAVYVHILRDPVDCVAAIERRWLEPPRDLRVPRQRDRIRRHIAEAGLWRSRHYVRELLQHLTSRRAASVVGVRPWGPRLPGLDQLVDDLELVEVCALQWRLCVEQAAAFGRALPAGRYVERRLEDLDRPAIESIVEHCGLDLHPAVVEAYEQEYDREAIVPRGESLPARERALVEQWVAPTVTWLSEH